MATQLESEKAKRAATKALKQRQQELEDQELIESTRQPRQAKAKALETAVWNGPQKRAASPEVQSKERVSKKSKGVKVRSPEEQLKERAKKGSSKARTSIPQDNHTGKAVSKHASTVSKKQTLKKRELSRLPAAAQIKESGSELEEDPVVLPSKNRTRIRHEIKDSDMESDCSDHSVKSQDSDSDDDDDLLDFESKDLSKVLTDEQPAILEPEVEENCVASLFDNDDDVLIDSEPPQDSGDVDDNPDVDMLSADHYSVPPTTDSERDIAMPDNEESEPEAVQRTNRRQPSSKSNPSRQSISVQRQKAFLAEKPKVQKTASGKMKTEKSRSTSSTNTTTIEWPSHASLVLPSAGKGLSLNSQHVYVGHVVRRAIAKLTEETLLIDAFLDLDKKINYHRRLLIDTAHKLMSELPPIGDMHDRLKEDIDFCDVLGKLVTDRLSAIRGPVKTHALVEIAAYELGKGDKCVERVEALFDRLVFIFPGSWSIDSKTSKEQWKFKANKPFLNSVIVDVIKLSFFNSPRAIGFQVIKKFVSTLDGHDEPELPAGLVALACTGIYAALDEWKTGSKVAAKFEGNIFATIYKSICRNLEGIKLQNPKAYHVIMAELYTLAISKPTAPSESEDALQIMDLTGF